MIRYLKLILAPITCCFLLHTSCWAYSLVLEWDPNDEPDLAGYILYYGTQSGVYKNRVDVGNITTSTVGALKPGVTYYFAVTAYDAAGLESGFSSETHYPANVPPQQNPGSGSGSGGGGGGGACFVQSSAFNSMPNSIYLLFSLSGVVFILLSLALHTNAHQWKTKRFLGDHQTKKAGSPPCL